MGGLALGTDGLTLLSARRYTAKGRVVGTDTHPVLRRERQKHCHHLPRSLESDFLGRRDVRTAQTPPSAQPHRPRAGARPPEQVLGPSPSCKPSCSGQMPRPLFRAQTGRAVGGTTLRTQFPDQKTQRGLGLIRGCALGPEGCRLSREAERTPHE